MKKWAAVSIGKPIVHNYQPILAICIMRHSGYGGQVKGYKSKWRFHHWDFKIWADGILREKFEEQFNPFSCPSIIQLTDVEKAGPAKQYEGISWRGTLSDKHFKWHMRLCKKEMLQYPTERASSGSLSNCSETQCTSRREWDQALWGITATGISILTEQISMI